MLKVSRRSFHFSVDIDNFCDIIILVEIGILSDCFVFILKNKRAKTDVFYAEMRGKIRGKPWMIIGIRKINIPFRKQNKPENSGKRLVRIGVGNHRFFLHFCTPERHIYKMYTNSKNGLFKWKDLWYNLKQHSKGECTWNFA